MTAICSGGADRGRPGEEHEPAQPVDGSDRIEQPGEHVVGRTEAVDLDQQAALGVEGDQRQRLGGVEVEPLADGILGVVGALHDLAAIDVADPAVLRRGVDGVDVPAGLADPALGDALEHHVLGHLEVRRTTSSGRSAVMPPAPGLGLGAGEAVEDVAPLVVSLSLSRSSTTPTMISSDTRPPASMTDLAFRPNSVPAATAARSMSPVEMWGTTKCWRQADGLGSLARALTAEHHETDAVGHGATSTSSCGLRSWCQEALVVAHHQLAVDLLDGLEGDAHGDEDRDAEEAELLAAGGVTEGLADGEGRDQGDGGDEERAGEGDPGEDLRQVALGLVAGADAGDEAALLADLVGLLVRVELDGRVEVGEEDDQDAVDGQVERRGRPGEVLIDELLDVPRPVRVLGVGFRPGGSAR